LLVQRGLQVNLHLLCSIEYTKRELDALESEAVSSVKIAFLLTIISTLIFSIVVLVSVVKPSIFDKINRIVNTTDIERARQYEEYDQKWVSGTKVLRVLKLYESTGFGIVYGTTKTKLSGDYAVNFGGLFQGAVADANGNYRISNFTSIWKTKNNPNNTFYTKGFQNIKPYENKAVSRHSIAALEYIQPDGRFYAELVKDITGETVGICFSQD
jgi:hypothetical protein